VKTFENAIEFLGDNTGLIWDKTLEHIWLSLASLGVALVIAIPLGVWLGHRHRGSFVAINVSNVGRVLPSLAVISIGLGILGVGFTNVMVALVILAAPVMLTNAYVAVDQVDPDRRRVRRRDRAARRARRRRRARRHHREPADLRAGGRRGRIACDRGARVRHGGRVRSPAVRRHTATASAAHAAASPRAQGRNGRGMKGVEPVFNEGVQ
jgi:ABC-type tungstate transport system substrate-binding protein